MYFFFTKLFLLSELPALASAGKRKNSEQAIRKQIRKLQDAVKEIREKLSKSDAGISDEDVSDKYSSNVDPADEYEYTQLDDIPEYKNKCSDTRLAAAASFMAYFPAEVGLKERSGKFKEIIFNNLKRQAKDIYKDKNKKQLEKMEYVENLCLMFRDATVHFHRQDKTYAYMFEFQEFCIISIRGTKTVKEMGQYIKVTLPRTENGLYKPWEKLTSPFQAWLSEMVEGRKSKKFIVTGHSKGGAVAQVAALYLAKILRKKPGAVITFASPLMAREGEFLNDYNANHLCGVTKLFEVEGDDVPGLPPTFQKTCGHVFKLSGKKHGMRTHIKQLLAENKMD